MNNQEKAQHIVQASHTLENENYDAFVIAFNRDVSRLSVDQRARLFDLITQGERQCDAS